MKHNCENTIAIGDFNVNPFETACISARNMHAIPFSEEVFEKPSRVVSGEEYKKFYNPTWKLFGNSTPPYSTYYYNKAGHAINYYWNAFDQVMVRPKLMKAFDETRLRIITETKSHQLINKKGIPDKKKYSEHLPLFCTIREEEIK